MYPDLPPPTYAESVWGVANVRRQVILIILVIFGGIGNLLFCFDIFFSSVIWLWDSVSQEDDENTTGDFEFIPHYPTYNTNYWRSPLYVCSLRLIWSKCQLILEDEKMKQTNKKRFKSKNISRNANAVPYITLHRRFTMNDEIVGCYPLSLSPRGQRRGNYRIGNRK